MNIPLTEAERSTGISIKEGFRYPEIEAALKSFLTGPEALLVDEYRKQVAKMNGATLEATRMVWLESTNRIYNPKDAEAGWNHIYRRGSKVLDNDIHEITYRFNRLLNETPYLKRLAIKGIQENRNDHIRAVMERVAEKKARGAEIRKATNTSNETSMIEELLLNGKVTEEMALTTIVLLRNTGALRIGARGDTGGKIVMDMETAGIIFEMNASMDPNIHYARMILEKIRDVEEPGNILYPSTDAQQTYPRYRSKTGEINDGPVGAYWLEMKYGREQGKPPIVPNRFDHDQRRAISAMAELVAGMIERYNRAEDHRLDPIFAERREETGAINTQRIAKKVIRNNRSKDELIHAQQDDHLVLPPETFRLDRMRNNGDMDHYQKKGVNWMMAVERGVLAFDTGLGKTLVGMTTAAMLMKRQEIERALIFAPVVLVDQWRDEILKFTRQFNVVTIRGNPMERLRRLQEDATTAHFVIAGYSTLLNKMEFDAIARLDGAVLMDEGKVFGNDNKTAKAAKKLLEDRQYGWILSATPVTNYPDTFFHTMSVVRPGELGPINRFKKAHLQTKTDEETGKKVFVGFKGLEKLKDRTEHLVFRKQKIDMDVNVALPPIDAINRQYEMPDEQKVYYEAAKCDALARLMAVQDRENITFNEKRNILRAIHHMRQMAISPELADPFYAGPAPKIDEAEAIITEHLASDPEHPVIVFSSFKTPFDILWKRLLKAGVPDHQMGRITGGMTDRMRTAVKQGINDGSIKVGFIGTAAGGYGLNLQERANTMIFLHDPWTPSEKEQAIARVWRSGQRLKVQVFNLAMKNTVDNHIQDLLAKKKYLATCILDGEDGFQEGNTKLTFEDLLQLIGAAA